MKLFSIVVFLAISTALRAQSIEDRLDSLEAARTELTKQIEAVESEIHERHLQEMTAGEGVSARLRWDAKVYDRPSLFGNHIGTIRAGDDVVVSIENELLIDGSLPNFVFATTDVIAGFMLATNIDESDWAILAPLIKEKEEAWGQQKEEERVAAARREAVAAGKERETRLHAEFAESRFLQDIVDRTIRLGMTDEEVRGAWGEPDDINRSVGAWGVKEQWVYRRLKDAYVYIANGVLVSWSN